MKEMTLRGWLQSERASNDFKLLAVKSGGGYPPRKKASARLSVKWYGNQFDVGPAAQHDVASDGVRLESHTRTDLTARSDAPASRPTKRSSISPSNAVTVRRNMPS